MISAELSGTSASSLSGGPTSGRTLTWRVGAKGTDATYSGVITNSTSTTAITKTGAGTWTLAGACTYTGATTVSAGVLRILGSVTGTTGLTIASGAAVELSGGTLSVSGTVTNNGTIRLKGTPTFSSTGIFTNNGVLDLINGPATLPANFVNKGTVLDSSAVKAADAAFVGSNFTVTVTGYAGHTYQLQRSTTINSPTWTAVGNAQSGTGGQLVFTDSGTAGTQYFYRVVVSP
ncbi:MAG: autotransporter-associated beta strand repeat-containing protein [Chthoniobacteraceae bacterium]